MHRRHVLPVVALLAAGGLAACGGGGESGGEPSTPEAVATTFIHAVAEGDADGACALFFDTVDDTAARDDEATMETCRTAVAGQHTYWSDNELIEAAQAVDADDLVASGSDGEWDLTVPGLGPMPKTGDRSPLYLKVHEVDGTFLVSKTA